jgi:hypothetical protein
MRAPQGQQAHSPGHRPGFLCGRWNYRAESAKAFALNILFIKRFVEDPPTEGEVIRELENFSFLEWKLM